MLRGFLGAAERAQDNAKIVVRAEVFGRNLQRATIAGHRLLRISLFQQGIAEIHRESAKLDDLPASCELADCQQQGLKQSRQPKFDWAMICTGNHDFAPNLHENP